MIKKQFKRLFFIIKTAKNIEWSINIKGGVDMRRYCQQNNYCYEECYCCCPKCIEGPIGPQGITGPQGPRGTIQLTNCATYRSTGTTSSVAPNGSINYGNLISGSGTSITHTNDTPEIVLSAEGMYKVDLAVDGVDNIVGQGLIFALVVDKFITDARIVSQNTQDKTHYNSGWVSYFVKVKAGKTVTITVQNIGLDTIDLVNSNISILQISSTVG